MNAINIKNGLKKAAVAGAIALSAAHVYAQGEPKPGLYVRGDERCVVSYPGGMGFFPNIECRTPSLWTEGRGDDVHRFRYVRPDGTIMKGVAITGLIVDFDAGIERGVAASDRKSGIAAYRSEEAMRIRGRHNSTKKIIVHGENYRGGITSEKW